MDVVPFETPSAQIPFVLMEARVNGERIARVLLDTGAAAPFAVMISPELARLSGAVRDGGSAAPSTGALGAAPVGFQPARLAEFRLGPIRLRDVSVGVTSALDAVSRQLGTRVDAIVGQRFVAGRTISIDYGAYRVDFAAAAGPPGAAVPFALAPKRPLTMIEVMLNGRGPFALALDTGASATLLSPATAKAAGIEAGEPVGLGGAGGAAAAGARMGRATIAFGAIDRADARVAIADVLEPVAAASGAPLDGVLGADFFGTGRLVIDYGARRLWLDAGGR